jgi:hypothetical protein
MQSEKSGPATPEKPSFKLRPIFMGAAAILLGGVALSAGGSPAARADAS